MTFVITFEDVFLCNIPKDSYGFVEDGIHFGISFLVQATSGRESTRNKSLLTPLRPFLRLSSINSEMNSGDFSLRFMNNSKA